MRSGGTDPFSERDGESTPADYDSPADDDGPVDLLVPTQLSADRQDATIQELPCPAPMAEAHFTWGPGQVSAEQLIKSVKAAYSEVVGSPIIDGPQLARIQRLFTMILGVAGSRLSLLSGAKAFKPSREKEGL